MNTRNIHVRFPLWFLLRVLAILAGSYLVAAIGVQIGDVLSRPERPPGETQLLFHWEPGEGHPDHYRVEVSETHYADPAQPRMFYHYVKEPELSLYGKDGYTYVLRVQALSPSGTRSAFSQRSETYLCEPDGTVRMIRKSDERPDLVFALSQNAPNPFNRETVIEYTVPASTALQVRLDIYNILGQTVRTLVQEVVLPGTHRIAWDGKNEEGREVASGTYVYRFECGPFMAAKTMSYVK